MNYKPVKIKYYKHNAIPYADITFAVSFDDLKHYYGSILEKLISINSCWVAALNPCTISVEAPDLMLLINVLDEKEEVNWNDIKFVNEIDGYYSFLFNNKYHPHAYSDKYQTTANLAVMLSILDSSLTDPPETDDFVFIGYWMDVKESYPDEQIVRTMFEVNIKNGKFEISVGNITLEEYLFMLVSMKDHHDFSIIIDAVKAVFFEKAKHKRKDGVDEPQ